MTLGPRIGQNRMKGQCIAVNARSCGSLAQFRASVNTHGECEGTMDGTNLVEAIKAGDVARVTECLAQSSAANAHDDRGQHPLHVAVIRNERIIARLLIEAGADLNERDNEGNTALHFAAAAHDPELVKVLLEGGAAINALDSHGNTPLHIAAQLDRVEAARALVTAGANLNLKDSLGRMPAKIASRTVREVIRRSLRNEGPPNDHRSKGRQQ